MIHKGDIQGHTGDIKETNRGHTRDIHETHRGHIEDILDTLLLHVTDLLPVWAMSSKSALQSSHNIVLTTKIS